MDTHTSWVKNINNIESIDDRKELLNRYVNRIMVSFNHEKNHHTIDLNLKIPMVNDGYEVVGKSLGKRKYEIKSGSSYFKTDVPPTKRGRISKKKPEMGRL